MSALILAISLQSAKAFLNRGTKYLCAQHVSLNVKFYQPHMSLQELCGNFSHLVPHLALGAGMQFQTNSTIPSFMCSKVKVTGRIFNNLSPRKYTAKGLWLIAAHAQFVPIKNGRRGGGTKAPFRYHASKQHCKCEHAFLLAMQKVCTPAGILSKT